MPRSTILRSTIALLASPAVCMPVLLSSCASPRAAEAAVDRTPVPATRDRIARTDWTCTSLAGASFPEGTPPSLSFGETDPIGSISVSGYAGVNRFGGSATITGGRLRFGALMSTRMAGPPERMELEAAFLAMLRSVDAASIEGETLTLSAAGTQLATFTRDGK
jgi:heat shock protein HslJ